MTLLLFGIGMVFVVEGLVLALAPSRVEEMLRALIAMPPEMRRLLGLLAMTAGALLLWLTNWLGS